MPRAPWAGARFGRPRRRARLARRRRRGPGDVRGPSARPVASRAAGCAQACWATADAPGPDACPPSLADDYGTHCCHASECDDDFGTGCGNGQPTIDGVVLATDGACDPAGESLGIVYDGFANDVVATPDALVFREGTGQLVFTGSNMVNVAYAHREQRPPTTSDLAEYPVSPALDALIQRCLAKIPAARPASAMELYDALGSIETEPWTQTEARQWWTQYRTRELETRDPGPAELLKTTAPGKPREAS